MRREELYLTDIVEAADAIKNFLHSIEREAFLQNDLVRSAVLQKLIIIGEAAARLPEKFRESHPDIEWEEVVAFRNIAVHVYFAVEWPIVWITATQEVPDLRRKVAVILSKEFSGTEPST